MPITLSAIAMVYWVLSGLTFLIYAWDKAAAVAGRRRTPEKLLHLFSVAGGWPGALVAQKLLRHKSDKREFQIMFWVTVMLNCGVLIWLALLDGADMRVLLNRMV
ncbi:MAG TPA: DUF1294 domain-containing protein [Thiobacillus sp.]